MTIKNVALVGANGNLGGPILDALVSSGLFNVTVLKRASSRSNTTSDPKVNIVTVHDDMTFDSLKAALQGQDACIASFPLKDPEPHLRLVDAAAAAGVKRFIPADYGSCDSSTKQAQELILLFKNKVRVRELCQEHAKKDLHFTWTSLVAGHFFDWGLRENFLHFDLKTKTADILDDGTYRSSTSTLARVAEAVVKVLQDEDVGRNKMLFMQSFCVSQLDILASLEKATGEKWKTNWIKSDDFIKEYKPKADAGDYAAVEHLVFALGAIDGDWEKKDGFAMDALGFQNEDLDDIVQKVVSEVPSS
ncbi:putative NmrA-like domain-containing protein [Seiridium cardinale]|uniref:NmrA-like domain-containing protein n=1 Tax=Seiridium cardinale TaxID=138064 RepID=A0ABR2XD88_9PEZI